MNKKGFIFHILSPNDNQYIFFFLFINLIQDFFMLTISVESLLLSQH